MPAPRHLREAPITEAIIDIRVKARQGFQPKEFERLRPELSGRFPNVQEQRSGSITFKFAPTGVVPGSTDQLILDGFRFSTGDGKLLAQFRSDGFTLNRLKPYPSWEELCPSALELWKIYCSVAAPEGVSRLALRYINQIPLPGDVHEFNRFLLAPPVIPPELPQATSAFLTRITIQDQNSRLAAHITQLLAVDTELRKSIILDIDAFREGSWSPGSPEIEATLNQLRVFKNLIFFSSLTEETLRQFE